MSAIEPGSGFRAGRNGHRRIEAGSDAGAREEPSRDGRAGLPVPLTDAEPRAASTYRVSAGSAALVAQLIATQMELPQTRWKRTAAVGEAVEAYRSAESLSTITPHARSQRI